VLDELVIVIIPHKPGRARLRDGREDSRDIPSVRNSDRRSGWLRGKRGQSPGSPEGVIEIPCRIW
jgi:hypothetical protein